MKPFLASFLSFYDLGRAWDFYEVFNKSKNLPYHNRTHVTLMLRDLAKAIACPMEKIHRDSARYVGLAAIFHDFNHSGGKTTDDNNIAYALDALHLYWYQSTENSQQKLAIVKSLIEVTQFPFLREPETEDERLIRDLDLMTIYHVGSKDAPFQDVGMRQIFGIWQESFEGKMSWLEFAEKNCEFLRSAVWYTEFGQDRAATQLEDQIDKFWNLSKKVCNVSRYFLMGDNRG